MATTEAIQLPQDAPPQVSTLDRLLAQDKIHRVLLRLGLTFAETQHIVYFDPTAGTAYWKYNTQTGEESIHLGPKVTALTEDCLEMVIRHELLHRSTFNGFGECYPNPTLSNIALDICINRLLFEAWPDAMLQLSRAIYPPESNASPICLCNCAARDKAIDPKWSDLWSEIWGRKAPPNPTSLGGPLNPASLYFRLMRFLPQIQSSAALNPFAAHPPQNAILPERMSARIRKAYKAATEGLKRALHRGSGTGHALSEFSVEPSDLGDSNLESFLLRLPIRRKMTDLAAKITEPARKSLVTLPYPVQLSRKGLIFAALGISQSLGLYWNEQPAPTNMRLIVALYMDVSGSMIDKFPIVAYCAETLKEYPLRTYTFDTSVREVPIEDLANGKIKGGGGTDFNALVQHILKQDEILASVVFTDDCGHLSSDLETQLRNSRHRLFLVNLEDSPTDSCFSGGLSKAATEFIRIGCQPDLIAHLNNSTPD